ncbi:MAG: hypothetical protein HQ591_00480 [candidate division Zixibacteria bacterium]|nr:hypothetical protein [Candidatus Tariuqbacter arcticus]
MKKYFISLVIVLTVSILAFCQPDTLWTRTFGGSQYDSGQSVQQTADGGFVLVGHTQSFGIGEYIYLIKTDLLGNLQWQQTYSGSIGNSVQQTNDDGYIIAGKISSPTWDPDICLIKTDSMGNLLWSHSYGGMMIDVGNSVRQTSDGGYIIAGETNSYGAGEFDMCLLKTDSLGNLLWQHTFGGIHHDKGYSVQQTLDQGYIITGFTIIQYWTDIYLVKTDSLGSLIWQLTFGGILNDAGNCVQPTSDGCYILTGYIESSVPVTTDVCLAKIDSIGSIIWQQTYVQTGWYTGECVQQTFDGGYVIGGSTSAFSGVYDVLIMKTDSLGNLLWQEIFGGDNHDFGYSVQQTSDGGYAIAGKTSSFGAGNYDVYLVRLEGILLPIVQDLVITISDGNAVLSWSDMPNAIGYNIYRSDYPYFDISGFSPIAFPANSAYTDSSVVSEGAYYYKVTVEY